MGVYTKPGNRDRWTRGDRPDAEGSVPMSLIDRDSKGDVSERWVNSPLRVDLLFAALAGLAGLAGSYAVAGYSRQFIVAPIDALVVRLTPGRIVAFMIDNVGEEAHLLHIALSFAIATGLLGAAALVGLRVAREHDRPAVGLALASLLGWAVTTLVTGRPVPAVAAAAPLAVIAAVGLAPARATDRDPSRRRVLTAAAGTLAAVLSGVGLGETIADSDGGGSTLPGDSASDDGTDGVAALVQEADEKSLDIEGDAPGLVSTFEEFYNVDIAEFDPDLSAENWSMAVTGEIDDDLTISFDELTDMPTEHRFVTLRCIGENLNGEKLDNAIWTGTPIKPILDRVDPDGQCNCAMLRAEDDYFIQYPIQALETAFLAWGMNGEPLPQSHGRPVRVLLPGHWGETNVKWLSEIELLDEEMQGYWEQRGWHGTGPVNTVAKLWSDTRLDNGNVEVAGHAYAGTRGIQRVEVSIDGGETWTDAELSDPLDAEDVWRQWRYEFEPDDSQTVVVRAVDGEGNLQQREQTDSFPNGAHGWVEQTIEV
jgi:DMSO/TMAO reductase YedYZ molybdopterin-dependent catalytic subunit